MFGICHRDGACDTLSLAAAAALVGCVSLLAVSASVASARSERLVDGYHQHTRTMPIPTVYEIGVASTYGEDDGFEGNLTACGQVFHTHVVQVAHKSLPCGTMIRIEDSVTGLSVVAEVTDRGPYIRGRIVDLSWGAFRQLEPSAPGLLNVKVYLLDE
jgi:rare lipoprotein A (peptidoglycan hydrolase)